MSERKSLSLCMITKNDEAYLSNSIGSMKDLVDEIIIADIGSTDSTVNIAKQAGAKVFQVKWSNDYSKAKNLCLDQAKGRWVLFLQGNEVISVEQLKDIRLLLDNPNVEGYLLYIQYPRESYRIFSPVESLRLFRNRREYRYQHKIFERIPDELLSNIKDTNVRIVHQKSPDSSFGIYSSIHLLENELRECSGDNYLQYMYGIQLLNQQKYEESIIYFQKARKNVNYDYLYAPHLYKCLTWSLISLEKYTDALDVLNEGINIFPLYTDLLVLRGRVQKQLYKYGEAIKDLERSLKISEQSSPIVPSPEIEVSIILEILAEVHEDIFNYQKALVCYNQSYGMNKNNHKLLYKIGKLSKKLGFTEVIENLIKQSMKQNNLQQLMTLIDVLLEQREYHKVLNYIEYLEALLSKGEQTESIKFFCYMMLEEIKEAELHFSNIKKESPLYTHMLLKKIEGFWLHNKWQYSMSLLKEIDEIKEIQDNIKELYHLLHRILTEEKPSNIILNDQEYEIIYLLMESFLWIGQKVKAQILLSLLLQGVKDDKCLKIGECWVQANDYQAFEKIYNCISNKEKQLQFKQIIIERLLQSSHIELAQRVMKLGHSDTLGALEYVLWSKDITIKLKKWIQNVNCTKLNAITHSSIAFKIHIEPAKDLVSFYHSLGFKERKENEDNTNESNEKMTCAEIHEEIGDFYLQGEKEREAISAYLRSVQWDPLNHTVQDKIKTIFNKDPSTFITALERINYFLEGNWFNHEQDFRHYVIGFIYFNNGKFDEALHYFKKISENEAVYPVILAYIASILCIIKKEEVLDEWINEQNRTGDFLFSLFHICKRYILYKLDEGLKEYPYSELIIIEKQRIGHTHFEEFL